ncbi:MAG: beta-N-acetylhexosaminidase [Gammaproteobacteria bacterium]|nr:beta-N-acetylhexosaminidase [Gammaproteobacteria bacterium]MCY4357755.1 beta-N-acetylhexosaminidase [Gammaproteobacteria bacterium]
MTDNHRPLGALMLDIKGEELSIEDEALLKRNCVGGLILFSRNYANPQQLCTLISQIRQCDPALLIAVDQEGGSVQRFRENFLLLPPLHALGEIYEEDADQARLLARTHGWAMAAETLHYGIDFSFAPVLDLYSSESKVIAERAFAADVPLTTTLARDYIGGMHKAGMIATGKHFPGHGTVEADSHYSLPIDDRSADQILGKDFMVFVNCIDLLDAIMPAHVQYPAIDAECAGFSKVWLQQKLRGQLNFQGVIFSDDLSMAAAQVGGDIESRTAKALTAGCDMVLACNDRTAALAVADYLDDIEHPGCARLSALAATPAAEVKSLHSEQCWHEAVELLQSLSSPDESETLL